VWLKFGDDCANPLEEIYSSFRGDCVWDLSIKWPVENGLFFYTMLQMYDEGLTSESFLDLRLSP
jgi:hypothetical protein